MAENDKLVGVLGGMGPAATIDFMSRVLAATAAKVDQQHVRMLVEQNPKVPNRQLAMLGEGEDPGASIAEMARRLQSAGVDFLVMPCNLAHAWQSNIEAAVDIPFLSIVDASIACAVSKSDDNRAVGLMTTPGCHKAGLYQRALADRACPLIEQTGDELETTMRLVERVKSGEISEAVEGGLKLQANKLIERGAQVLIAACTELPIVLNTSMFDVAFVSSTEALARKTVALATGEQGIQS